MAKTKRTPVGGRRDILTISDQDPNYVYRWVNDTPGRLQRFIEGGYEVVVSKDTEVGSKTVDKGSRVGSAVTKAVGGRLTAVAMRIPKEWYDEDQAAKQDAIADVEAQMKTKPKADYGSLTIERR